MADSTATQLAEIAELCHEARELVDADGDAADFPFPYRRAVDLAVRLCHPGPKAGAVSASECHEIAGALIEAYDQRVIEAHQLRRALSRVCPVQSSECAIRGTCTNKCGALDVHVRTKHIHEESHARDTDNGTDREPEE